MHNQPSNMILSPSSQNGNVIFGGLGSREDQLYSTDEDGVMRLNSVVVANPQISEEEQMFMRSENNASQIKMIKAQMKRDIQNAKGNFPSSAPEGNVPGIRKISNNAAINLR